MTFQLLIYNETKYHRLEVENYKFASFMSSQLSKKA